MKKQKNVKQYGILFLMSLSLSALSAGVTANNNLTSSSPKGDKVDVNPVANKGDQNSFLQKLVVKSDLIFRGKLTEISEGLSIEQIPYTFVTYDVEEVITGQYSNATITLKFVGGEFPNGNRLTATNSPSVNLGEESILLVQQSINTGCDFVECEHGRFLLENGNIVAANESAIVIDDAGGLDYISLAARMSGEHKSSLAKSNIPSFISLLKSLDEKSSLQRQTTRPTITDTDKYTPFNAYPALTRAQSGPKVPKNITKNIPLQQEGNKHDQWEAEQLQQNGGNPLLDASYTDKQD